MSVADVLYNSVVNEEKPLSERIDAMRGLSNLSLTHDVIEVLSKIARDTKLPPQLRQMASDQLFKK